MNSADDLPELPGIDKADGLRRIMNKPALYEKILRDCHARLYNAPQTIGDALSSGDLEGAGRLVHSAKGLAGTIGAMALLEATKALELALRNGEAPSNTTLLRFEHELRTVIDGIAAGFGIEPAG